MYVIILWSIHVGHVVMLRDEEGEPTVSILPKPSRWRGWDDDLLLDDDLSDVWTTFTMSWKKGWGIDYAWVGVGIMCLHGLPAWL